jgi:Putative transposase
VHCTAWGEGDEAVLRYLARYVFRVAITNNRIVGLDDKGVTIRHKDRKSMQWRTTRLTGHEFMRRFLQHVLPKGLHKVRYYGLCTSRPMCDTIFATPAWRPRPPRDRAPHSPVRICQFGYPPHIRHDVRNHPAQNVAIIRGQRPEIS